MSSPDLSSADLQLTRRHFFERCAIGLAPLALASALRDGRIFAAPPKSVHHVAKAKQVIYLFMAGGPSQFELFDDKPKLREFHKKPPPKSLFERNRFAFLKGNETLLGPQPRFGKYGVTGATISDLLPHHRKIVDELCFLRAVKTDVFNHGPAKILMNTGTAQTGRPSMGSWLTYGIGSESDNLPGFVVLKSGPRGPRNGSQLWSSGFLPSTFQGVPFRKGSSRILNLESPPGYTLAQQGDFVDAIRDLNRLRLGVVSDPEIATRIAAYEMAYRMQMSAPELMDIRRESKATLNLYGVEPGESTFAANCLLARRLVERGVRFVQLYHTNWDHHGGGGECLYKDLPVRCREIDQAIAALISDLKTRGLLDETLVIWGGEFGRTPMGEVRDTIGRDHHIEAFTVWLAGGGVKPGMSYGATDELGFGATENPTHVHDLHATILQLLGIDHTRLTYRFQGQDVRLTDVFGEVVSDIVA